MKLNHSEQQQFINMLNGDKMNKDKNNGAVIAWCIVLFIMATIIRVYALIYCVQWGLGIALTVRQSLIIGAISGLYANKPDIQDDPVRYLVKDMMNRALLPCLCIL